MLQKTITIPELGTFSLTMDNQGVLHIQGDLPLMLRLHSLVASTPSHIDDLALTMLEKLISAWSI